MIGSLLLHTALTYLHALHAPHRTHHLHLPESWWWIFYNQWTRDMWAAWRMAAGCGSDDISWPTRGNLFSRRNDLVSGDMYSHTHLFPVNSLCLEEERGNLFCNCIACTFEKNLYLEKERISSNIRYLATLHLRQAMVDTRPRQRLPSTSQFLAGWHSPPHHLLSRGGIRRKENSKNNDDDDGKRGRRRWREGKIPAAENTTVWLAASYHGA